MASQPDGSGIRIIVVDMIDQIDDQRLVNQKVFFFHL